MTEDEIISYIDNQFRRIVNENFPEIKSPSSGSSGPSFHIYLPTQNKYFKDTPYYYNGNLEFIHWTSIDNLFSIINGKTIRFYNLIHSEDESEFILAAKAYGMSDGEIEYAKKYYYTFSCCSADDLESEHLWKHYGNDYKGAAIRFRITNNPEDWNRYHISKIQYNIPQRFETFRKQIQELEFEFSSSRVKLKFDFDRFLGFHKKNQFANEKEVRIATYYPYENFEEYDKFAKTQFRFSETRNRISSYIELPLWVNNKSAYVKSSNPELDRRQVLSTDYFTTHPKIEILNIYFGMNCGLQNKDYLQYSKILRHIIKMNFGYEVNLDLNLFGKLL